MNSKEVEEKIIRNYQKDEKMMIFVFAQFCINHDLDPEKLYENTYPTQGKNHHLEEAIALTVPKEEAGEIPLETLLTILSAYGNDDLAHRVTLELEHVKKG